MHSYFLISYLRSKKIAVILLAMAILICGSFLSTSAQAPTITSFTPTTICQGDPIKITGTGFSGMPDVLVGNTAATNIKVVNSTTITANVANNALSGAIKVTVNNLTGTSTTSLTVNPAPQPLLNDVSSLDAAFTNCDGNATYTLTVSNGSSAAAGSAYTIDWGDKTPVFTATDWAAGAQTSHTFTAQGYFNIVLTIVPTNGCTKKVTYKFYNGTNPLASLTTTSSTTGLCIPAPIEFQIGNWFNNSPGTIYQLDFGDFSTPVSLSHPLNATNTVQLVSHTYLTSSCPAVDFTATLKAINGCFTTTYTLNQIIVRKPPIADFATDPANTCASGPVCFINNTTDGYSGNSCNSSSIYSWDFGDDSTSTMPAPCHSYAIAGTYNVTLVASNAACGSDMITKQVIVRAPSPIPTVAAPSISYCQGQTAKQLTATGNGLLWYTSPTGGIGSSIAPTPSTNFPGTTNYYVSQTLANSCESPRVAIAVTVSAAPNAPIVNTPVQLCQNQTATPLTASGGGLLWYTSMNGGTGSATPPTPSTTTLGSTTYYVSQTTNTCESPRAAIEVIVNSLATAPLVTSPLIYCQNQTAAPLTATGTGLLWYTVATGGTGNAAAPTPSTTTVGTITYYVSQVTGCGESPRDSIKVTIKASPSATIKYSLTNLCNVVNSAGNPNPPITVTLTGTGGGSYSIVPSTGLPINASTGSIDPSGATAGNYTITYTIPGAGGCSDFSTTAAVSVNGTPTSAISYPPVCSSDGITAAQITGSKGGVFSAPAALIIDATTGAITPANSTPGTYVVTYTIAATAPCPGFITTTSVVITKAPTATISYSITNICGVVNSGSTPNPTIAVTLTGTGGGSYTISPANGLPIDAATGTLTPSGATPGQYTITYSLPGAGGCANFTTTASVTVSGAPTATISYPGSPFCQGINAPQPVAASGTPGGTYSAPNGLSINASTGDVNPSLSTPGVYKVSYTIAPSAPCPGYIAITSVEIDESPVLTFPVSTQSVCSGSTAAFTPSSTVVNTTYSWSVVGTLPATVSGVTSGNTSGSNASITLSFTNTGTTSEQIIVQVTPSNSSSNPCAGAPYDITLNVNPVPNALPTDTANLCMGTPSSTLSATPDPGNTIKWYDDNLVLLNGAPVVSTSVPVQLIYHVSQTNTFGCESPKSVVVAIVHPKVKIISSSFTNPTTCGIPSGTIVLNVLDLNNNPIPDFPLFVHYNKFQTPYQIFDSTNTQGQITIPLVAGTYSGIFVETGGCNSQPIPNVYVLKDPNPPAQPVAGYNPPLCSETQLNLTAISATSNALGPINYVWVGPAFGSLADTSMNTTISFPSASVSDAGTYIVYAIQNNCISPATSFQVVIKQAPSKPIINTRTPLCIGDDLVLQAFSSIPGANAVLNYSWTGPGRGFPVNTPNAGINSVVVQDAGIYTITVNSPQTGCSSTTDTLIQIGGYPIVQFPQDSLTLPTGYLLALAPTITNAAIPGILPIKSFEWTPSQDITCKDSICSSPVANIKDNICYNVKATNIYGCSGTAVICVKVFCQNSQVFIPNAFTPHGNLENRILMVRASGIASVKSFRIFNRWGRIVFEQNNFTPNNPDYGWDGMVNGKLADAGVYVYTAEVICDNGVSYFKKGNITLLY